MSFENGSVSIDSLHVFLLKSRDIVFATHFSNVIIFLGQLRQFSEGEESEKSERKD